MLTKLADSVDPMPKEVSVDMVHKDRPPQPTPDHPAGLPVPTLRGTEAGGPIPSIGKTFTQHLKRQSATEQMVDRIMSRLDRLEAYWQQEDKIQEKLDKVGLNHLVISETLLLDRLQALQGKATQIIGVQHQQQLDKMLPALMEAIKQRGLTVTATQHTLEVAT
jgi:hypothetical protein